MNADPKKVTGIILMAGVGNRFGSALPKQFHRLAGKKIYQHTLDQFILSHLFDDIVLVCPSNIIEQVQKEIPPFIRLTTGGPTRQESSYLGLLACPNADIVCIHDAVRPFITGDILKENIAKALLFGAADTCIASADTLVYAPDLDKIHSIPLRNHYLRGQTPQTFHYELILQAHRFALNKGNVNRSDDCSLVAEMGHPIHVVQGSEHNIKITTELDLCLAEQIFRLGQNKLSSFSQSSLKGKHYIVTGGTGGIGKALCEQLEREGAIALPLSRSSTPYAADLTSYDSVKKIFSEISTKYGPVDGLINSIGHLKCNPLKDLSCEDIEQQLSANLKALIFCCKYALLKIDAHIVNIASSSYARGRKDFTVYSSAKAAVVNFTQGLAEERPELFINAIVPQRTRTSMRLQNFDDADLESLLEPQDIAQEIIALLKKRDLNGSIIEIRKK